MNNKYCYLRVSTVEQNLDRQLEAMKKYDIPQENYFMEKLSGKDTNRPELQKLFNRLEEGDTLYIHDFSRLSRSTADLLTITEMLADKGVTLISNKENLDTSTPTGKLMLTMIGAINEFERLTLLERQKEGIELCKQRDGYRRKDFDFDQLRELKAKVDAGEMTVTEAAKEAGITRKTWYLRTKHLGNNSDTLDA